MLLLKLFNPSSEDRAKSVKLSTEVNSLQSPFITGCKLCPAIIGNDATVCAY